MGVLFQIFPRSCQNLVPACFNPLQPWKQSSWELKNSKQPHSPALTELKPIHGAQASWLQMGICTKLHPKTKNQKRGSKLSTLLPPSWERSLGNCALPKVPEKAEEKRRSEKGVVESQGEQRRERQRCSNGLSTYLQEHVIPSSCQREGKD